MLAITAKALLMLMSLSITPGSHASPTRVVQTQFAKSADEDLVKAACKIWWNLPDPVSTSAAGLATWARQQLPNVYNAVIKAGQAKKLNKKWNSFYTDMFTFAGSLYLGKDTRFSKIMFTTTIEMNSMKNLQKVCSKRH